METTFFKELGLKEQNAGTSTGLSFSNDSNRFIDSFSPVDGSLLGRVSITTDLEFKNIMEKASAAFVIWRAIPAPKRGEVVRQYGDVLRKHKEALGKLVSAEMGKSLQEGYGEVQEMIDICDFAVGLSRQLYGLTMHSERPGHRMYEQWHPLGPIGIMSAFNFPVAVWSWNAALATVCGDTMIWKPSPMTPLTAIAVQHLCNDLMSDHKIDGLFNLTIGTNEHVAQRMLEDRRLPLISFTGSCEVGKHVAEVVGRRMGKTLLELGGNNAIIVEPDADLNLAIRGILFGAVGTAGQRCTTTRRLLVHESVIEEVQTRLLEAYAQVKIGDPLDRTTLMGPLVSPRSVAIMFQAIQQAVSEGGSILCGGQTMNTQPGNYVAPTIIRMPTQSHQVRQETFAPILYLMSYRDLAEAITMHNDVPQGLSSSIFTTNLITAEKFLSAAGSDCGIANVNIGTSGAEIGGAFGGEKDTGGGRESGSDSWKAYMRRQTNTINWSTSLPLAQGIQFG